MDMFCRQCEQTAQGKGCTIRGVCGKTAETAILQDLLIHSLKGIAVYGTRAHELGIKDRETDDCVMEGLFTTVTNVNFDPERLEKIIRNSYTIKEKIKKLCKPFSENFPAAADWIPADTYEGLIKQGTAVGVLSDTAASEDIRSAREILLYGLKGMAAYAHHAALLGSRNEEVNAFFHKGLAALTDRSLSLSALVALIMEFGKVNLACLKTLDQAHTSRLGNPAPTAVSLTIKKGPAIIVSGHDLLDLEQLLRQTQGTGISVYTHGEMLPAHGYPGLKKYAHLAGHFGSAWQNQQKEFDNIPAVILMTTNCIQQPKPSYKDRIFTTGLVAWPGVAHIEAKNGKKDFSAVIKTALELGGFTQEMKGKDITVGFGHTAVMNVADTVVAAVKSGAIKHFFLIGGCDGAKPGRNYYTEFAQRVQQD